MRIAIISDIHGNRLALEAVLDDIRAQSPDLMVNLGDNFAGPMDPAGVARILRDLDLPSVRGNHDRYLADRHTEPLGPVDQFAADEIGADNLAWNDRLPLRGEVDDTLFLCHGSPDSDMVFWLEGDFDGRTSNLPSETAVAARAEGITLPVIACGHSHRPRAVRLRDGRLIVNPGSVGLQFVHGSPDARYAILDKGNYGRWSVNLRVIAYDHEGAAAQATRNGFAQWREALTTGWIGPEGLF